MSNEVRVVRGRPDDVEVAALVAGLAAVASASGLPDDEAPVEEWTNRARTVRGNADRDKSVIEAEAERDAQKLRGEGDAEAARIFGEAANKDPSFFAFQRSLDAYRRSFADGNAVIVLDKNDPFLQYLRDDR